MNTPPDRELIERRFGPLGSGAQSLAIRGVQYSLAQLLARRLGLRVAGATARRGRVLPGPRIHARERYHSSP